VVEISIGMMFDANLVTRCEQAINYRTNAKQVFGLDAADLSDSDHGGESSGGESELYKGEDKEQASSTDSESRKSLRGTTGKQAFSKRRAPTPRATGQSKNMGFNQLTTQTPSPIKARTTKSSPTFSASTKRKMGQDQGLRSRSGSGRGSLPRASPTARTSSPTPSKHDNSSSSKSKSDNKTPNGNTLNSQPSTLDPNNNAFGSKSNMDNHISINSNNNSVSINTSKPNSGNNILNNSNSTSADKVSNKNKSSS
jgi:hypothetical protein